MRTYQGIRISVDNRPTYGDKYRTIISENELQYNEIITRGNERILILFEEQEEQA